MTGLCKHCTNIINKETEYASIVVHAEMIIRLTGKREKKEMLFCCAVCTLAWQLDEIIINPVALNHMDRTAWIPVLKQLHDEICKH